jgi:hypothetical protein
MTLQTLYDLRTACSKQAQASPRRIVAAAFPDTDGALWAVHNWYRCAKSGTPEGRVAEALCASEWDRVHRVQARIDKWRQQVEHRNHTRISSRPSWCALCQ